MYLQESIKSSVPVGYDANHAPVTVANTVSSTPFANNGTHLRTKSFHTMSTAAANIDAAASVISINTANNMAPKGKTLPKAPDEFYRDLQQFHERRATPIMYTPKISGREIDLHRLYSEVTERGGFNKVNQRDEWDEVLPVLEIRDKCVNATAAVKYIYRRCLEKYERLNFFGEDPDKLEALESADVMEGGGRSRGRYPASIYSSNSGISNVNTVPMSYNYRQHIVNMDRRHTYKLSTDLHKHSPYEKLMLSLISPLPNEQDFAINVCSLMSNENKHTLKLNEYPKLLDVLLAHTGVFPDYTLRKLFQHVYTQVRKHSLFNFWRDLLREKPQILELYTDEQAIRDAGLIDDEDIENVTKQIDDNMDLDFFNLGPGEGTQEYIGQRVQQIVAILRNLSFFEENINVFAKNRSFMRFIVMGANIRWGNLHNQILDIAGNIATEIELLDPSTDDVSRSLLATLCNGIESMDRGVIINSLETLYKLCQTDGNEEYINKCLQLKFYENICQFLCLNDIMLLIFTLETIYALTSLGTRSCHLIMQVRGIVDQLVSLITVEAQSYGPDGCILMRVVETVPGNMLPMVAQNIANLQNVSVIQKPAPHVLVPTTQLPTPQAPLPMQVTSTQITPSHPQLTTVKVPQATTDSYQNQQPMSIDQTTTMQTSATVQQLEASTTQQQVTNVAQLPSGSTQNFTHEDEQYALAWLGATFERATSTDSHVEQQELYRMYLAHCQKFGKHSVVNHLQFPRLVRLIYTNNVGPMSARRSDGTELPGFYYVGIRLRAQPLPIQSSKLSQNQSKALESKLPTKMNTAESPVASLTPARKLKKKPKLQHEPDVTSADVTTPTLTSTSTTATTKQEPSDPQPKAIEEATSVASSITTTNSSSFSDTALLIMSAPHCATPSSLSLQHSTDSAVQPSSSLIKSLLANKVTQRQQKNQKEINTAANSNQSTSITSATASGNAPTPQPIKVASTAISALVNNPLMQNTAVKVGQTTIKPLNPQVPLEKKPLLESTPPPLAPLSGNNVAKDSSGRPVIIANQMLVEILDKKGGEPPIPSTIIKRKIEECAEPAKRLALESINIKEDSSQVTPSKNAANLYAEMAASILEDEDLEDIPPLPSATSTSSTSTISTQSKLNESIQQQQILIPAKIQQATLPGVQRQLVFQSSQPPQLKLTAHGGVAPSNQLPTAMATIKTDQGLQTVPVILQQKPIEQAQPSQLIQQVITQNIPQTAPQQQPTQYVLATNQQGQTYLVAQQPQPQPPPPQQTVLVTQTPQQQSTGAKTIIILQQQTVPGQQTHPPQPQLITSGSQKMIMTTPQGQVVVTQRPQASLPASTTQQYFINPQTGTATHIQHVPVSSSAIAANVSSSNQFLQRNQILSTSQVTTIAPTQTGTGQISPSLLSQLNHIPATIKLHQPQMPTTTVSSVNQHQPATISRIGKTVSIVQSAAGLTASPSPIQIPQLQQHQSIIQQHIISGPSEKRQMILGGRAIEIKETVITQTQPPAQQSQLNSQTIITKQVLPQPQQQQQLQTQQQTQQIRTVIEQQQQHPSIIQQKLCLQQPQKSGEQTNINQSSLPNKSVIASQTNVQHSTSLSTQSSSNATVVQQIRTQTQQQLITTPGANNKIAVSEPPPLTQTSRTANTVQPQPKEVSKANEVTSNAVNTTTTIVTVPTTTQAMATTSSTPPPAGTVQTPLAKPTLPMPQLPQVQLPPGVAAAAAANATPPLDPNWLYVCDWRNCPRRKYKSLNDLQHHAFTVHCPDHLDPAAEIFCQWGVGPGLCDGIPRKRYSLMTHIIDRHLTTDNLNAAAQRRVATGTVNLQPTQAPVTIVRNVEAAQAQAQRNNTASPAPSTSSSSSGSQLYGIGVATSSAMNAIKRHTADYVKEVTDENEGPVTKSIRLTAALILRNLVTYTSTAKRNLRRYESHLSNIALSNVESSGAISHILFELNN